MGQDSRTHSEPAATEHSHRDHYIHLCLTAEAVPGWALPTLSHYASKQRVQRNLPKVMQIPTTKQDSIPLCLVQTMKSGFFMLRSVANPRLTNLTVICSRLKNHALPFTL